MTTLAEMLLEFTPPALNPMTQQPWPSEEAKWRYYDVWMMPGLRNYLESWASTSQGAAWLVSMVRHRCSCDPYFRDYKPLPEDVIKSVAWLGYGPETDLLEIHNAALASKVNVKDFWRSIAGYYEVPGYDALEPISSARVVEAVKSSLVFQPGLEFRLSDSAYRRLPRQLLKAVVEAWPGSRLQWLPTRRDCDDFVRGFLGWLSMLGYGDLAILGASMVIFDAQGVSIGGHIILAGVTEGVDNADEAELYEPQGAILVDGQYAANMPGGAYHEIYSVYA